MQYFLNLFSVIDKKTFSVGACKRESGVGDCGVRFHACTAECTILIYTQTCSSLYFTVLGFTYLLSSYHEVTRMSLHLSSLHLSAVLQIQMSRWTCHFDAFQNVMILIL